VRPAPAPATHLPATDPPDHADDNHDHAHDNDADHDHHHDADDHHRPAA
jgi:hypothetical protein